MIKKLLAEILILLIFAGFAFGQEPTPTPAVSAAQQRMAQLQEQIDLLKKQQEYEQAKSDLANRRLNELLAAVKSEVKGEKSQTTFNAATVVNPESAELSYIALKELSEDIVAIMHPATSRYEAIVIYNEPDFLGLAKYRVYSNQSKTALTNYRDWRKKLEDSRDEIIKSLANTPEAGNKIRGAGRLKTLVSLPALATGFAGSIGELLSLFRTETIIYESSNTVDSASLGTAMANELRKKRPNLKVFYPAAFLPEYDVEADGNDTILMRISDINMAYADVSEFLAGIAEISEADRNKPPLKGLIAEAENVSNQLRWLAVAREKIGGQSNRNADDGDEPRAYLTDLRQLVRAEKLDRFMRQGSASLGSATGPQVGILKLRSLASGGSRRETRNLFLGNKIRYNGSVTLEVLLFDVDGTLRTSEIFSGHTGFRKLEK